MRASHAEQIDDIGMAEVRGALARLQWGPVEVHTHDLGTDIYAQARDANGVDLGLLVGVQVKSGPSFFREPKRDGDDVVGWWFRESDRRHFDYWLGHAVPHIVVLCDVEARVAYWASVTRDSVQDAGAGAKVLVPANQRIDRGSADALLSVARAGRVASWEGSNWTAGADVPAAAKLRYALLVPRLVAPHPNAGGEGALDPTQALALLVAGRVQELGRGSFERRTPTLEDAVASDDWRWRLYGHLACRLLDGGPSDLVALLDSAPDRPAQAAAAVCAAAYLVEQALPGEAITLLEGLDVNDDWDPVDRGWVAVQHARALLDLGRKDEARGIATTAQSVRAAAPADATASAIAGVALATIFNASGASGVDLRSLLTASDTVANWWRAQSVVGGLQDVVAESFRDWAHDPSVTVGGEDVANNRLVSAALTSSLVGAQGGWASYESLNARERLRRHDRHSDPESVAHHLSQLRRAGDAKSIALAGRHLLDDGPAEALRLAAGDLDLDASTRTTGLAGLRLLEASGDVLAQPVANDAACWLLRSYDDASAFESQTAPTYLVEVALLETMAAVLPAADAEVRAEVAKRISGLPAIGNELEADGWAKVVSATEPDDWTADTLEAIERNADAQPLRLRWAMRRAAVAGDEAYRERLIETSRTTGSLDAVGALESVRDWPDDLVAKQIAADAGSIAEILKAANKGVHGSGVDVGRNLAVLNLHRPDLASWGPLLDLLRFSGVVSEQRAGALNVIAGSPELVPLAHRDELLSIGADLIEGRVESAEGFFPRPGLVRRAATLMVSAIGGLDDPTAGRFGELLAGGDHVDRLTAARMVARWQDPAAHGVIVALAADSSPVVRATAAGELPRVVADGDGGPLVATALDAAIADPGTLVPFAVAAGLAALDTEDAKARLKALSGHHSARVRKAALGRPE